jgi:hypothetical protein
MNPPELVSNIGTTMTLNWTEVSNNGACDITGYTVYMDDGSSGNPTTGVPGIATDLPSLREAAVSLSVTDLGKTFTYKIRATNRMGYVESTTVSFLFAVEASTPSTGPQIISYSSSNITVRYSQALSSNGGTPLISYNLQYKGAFTDNSYIDLSGSNSTVDTLLTEYTVNSTLKGETYTFRYRVKNSRGWSQFSPETTVIAADAPTQPLSAPRLTAIPSANSIAVAFE